MSDRLLSWIGIYWYTFRKGDDIIKVYGRYLEDARNRVPDGYQLLDTNDGCII